MKLLDLLGLPGPNETKEQRRRRKTRVVWTMLAFAAMSCGAAVLTDIGSRTKDPKIKQLLQCATVFWGVFVYKIMRQFLWGAQGDDTEEEQGEEYVQPKSRKELKAEAKRSAWAAAKPTSSAVEGGPDSTQRAEQARQRKRRGS